MKTLKKTYSKNNNEIVLIEAVGLASWIIGSSQKCDSGRLDVLGSLLSPAHLPKSAIPPYTRKSSTVLIIGVVHGDEPQGKVLIEEYLKKNSTSPLEGEVSVQYEQKFANIRKEGEGLFNRLLFIPCLNPDGLQNKTRQNANLIDINRNFPTKNWEKTEKNTDFYGGEEAASEIETKFVVEVIEEFSPDIILTLHAPYKVVNYDGPAKKIAEDISKIINYPAESDIGYPTPGSFGTYAGVERNIPTLTLELDETIATSRLQPYLNEIFDYLALH